VPVALSSFGTLQLRLVVLVRSVVLLLCLVAVLMFVVTLLCSVLPLFTLFYKTVSASFAVVVVVEVEPPLLQYGRLSFALFLAELASLIRSC
jgi:hypothetical protein